MSLIGSNWKEEKSHEEQYNEIKGREYLGNNLNKEIDKEIDDNWTSRLERQKLRDLKEKINNENK